MTRAQLVASAALAGVLAFAGEALALPTSPVIAGTNGPNPGATFSFTPTTLTVTQTNSRVAVDWSTFNVAAGETVTFAQPSNTAIALNRVNASSLTTISGALNANGGVWIFSPAGILIGNGAAVNVGSFLGSTAIANSTTVGDFLCDCGTISFFPQPSTANPSITVQSGATINANAGFVELNGPSITQGGNVTASDSVDYSALPGGEIDFDEQANGLKLNDVFGNAAPALNQATSLTHTGNTTAGKFVALATFNDPSLGAPVASVINLSGHITADGIIDDSTTGTPYSVLLIADIPSQSLQNGAFQIPANSITAINASNSVITASGRIGVEAGTISTGDWTERELGGLGLDIEAGSGGLTVSHNLNFTGFGEATLTSLGPISISGAITSSTSDGLSVAGPSIALTGSIATPHGFLNLSTAGALTITGAINVGPEGGSLIESGSSAVVLNGAFGAGGDLGQNVSLTFTGAPDSGQSLTIGGQAYGLIFNQSELLAINNNLAGHYALATSVDLTGTIFGGSPIASLVSTPFTGTFTGLGNTIANLSIKDLTPVPQLAPSGYAGNGVVGLFGRVGHSGVVENVALANAQVSGGDGETVGALVGGLDGTVVDASATGVVSVGNHVNLNIGIAYAAAGGLVGASDGSISNSRSFGTVTGGDAFVGGLVGSDYAGGAIANSRSADDVHVGDNLAGNPSVPLAGGLVGIVDGFQFGGVNPLPTPVSGSDASGHVFGGAGATAGGFVGDVIEGQISTSSARGSVALSAGGQNGSDSIGGGFAGFVGDGGVITQSYAEAPVTTVGSSGAPITGGVGNYFTFAGGFVGDIDQGDTGHPASVSNSYALGSVTNSGTAFAALGGFAGTILRGSSADHVYASGQVSGPGNAAGLVGVLGDTIFTNTSGSISDSYWDEGTTGQINGVNAIGTGSATSVIGVGGATPRGAYAASSYANFDLTNTWFMIDGETRPMLRSEYSTTIYTVHQLQLMDLNLSANYSLGQNIDAHPYTNGIWNPANGFVPVGPAEATAFTGSLDGAGHAINDLTIVDTTPVNTTAFGGYAKNGFAGLFGYVGPGGLVENLQINNASVTASDGMAAGVLAGALEGAAMNVATSGAVTTGNGVTTGLGFAVAGAGGLAGAFDGLAINTSSSASVSGGDAFAGGLIGTTGGITGLPGGIIYRSHASGDVTVGATSANQTAVAGGLVAVLFGYRFGTLSNPIPTSVSTSYATGNVTGGSGSVIGGFVGDVTQSSVSASYATGMVTQTAGGNATQVDLAGGFAGAVGAGSDVDKSYSSGAVSTVGGATNTLFSFAGGFVGDVQQGGQVQKDYSLSPVTSTGTTFSLIGGFAGLVQTGGQVDQSYATGQLTAAGGVGGLVGLVAASSFLSNSYWDEGTTGRTNAVAFSSGTVTNVAAVGGSSGHSPYAASSYPAFNFSSGLDNGGWVIISGETRPVLGAEFSPIITSAHQLELMGLNILGNFTLANDIDMSETTSASGVWNPANGFVPIGGNGQGAFRGVFDGQGHTISNLTIIDSTPNQATAGIPTLGTLGLFGYANNALLENVNLVGAHVTGGDGMRAGALVGSLFNSSVINASSSGTVTVGNTVINGPATDVASAGGLVGASNGSIFSSRSSATVTAGSGYAGGLVGSFFGVNLVDSYATGAVTTGSFSGVTLTSLPLAGGLAGLIQGPGLNVSGSHATGPVSGGAGSVIGGFAGVVGQGATVSASYATGPVVQTLGGQNGSKDLAGGFVGDVNGGTVNRSFASGAVQAVGGSSGLVTHAGGFAGAADGGVISDAYATGLVTSSGSSFITLGGFIGLIDVGGAVTHVYATGPVSGVGLLEGLAGQVGDGTQSDTSGQISNSDWDEGTTGRTSGVSLSGTGTATNVVGIGGATSNNPFVVGAYAGWDFNNTWSTPSAGFYPQLFGASHVLRITGGATTYTYGGYTAVTYTPVGLQSDSSEIVSGLQSTIASTTTSTSGFYNVGAYGVTFGSATAVGASGPYRILYTPGSLTVTPRPLGASLVGVVEKTYDGTTNAAIAGANIALSNRVAGDVVSASVSGGGSYATRNAGHGIVVTAAAFSLSGADAGDYSLSGGASAAIGTIDPAALTIAATSDSRAYNGSVASSGAPQVTGLVGGDSISSLSQSFDSKNAGSRTLSVNSGYSVSDGNGGANYVVTLHTASGTITPAQLSLSAVTDTKTYDGGVASSATPQTSGLFGNDAVSNLSQSFDRKNAGSRTLAINPGYSVSDGNAGGNYVVTLHTASGAINPKALTASLAGEVKKPFDGTTSATLADDNYLLSGSVNGDSVTLNNPTTGAYDTPAPGTGKTVTVNGLQLSGADAQNYQVNQSASGDVGTITAVSNPAPPIQLPVPVQTPGSPDLGGPPTDAVSQVGNEPPPPAASDTSTAGGAASGGAAAATNSVSVVSVFPVISGVADTRVSGDNSPVTGAGNGDLWTGSDQDDEEKR
jgi:filamentous hemagglutinin family protein